MNCEDCKSKDCIDTTCRTCWPKMVIMVEKDNLASINHVLLKAGVKYTANEGDTIISHQRVNDKDIAFNPGESFVAAPEDRAPGSPGSRDGGTKDGRGRCRGLPPTKRRTSRC